MMYSSYDNIEMKLNNIIKQILWVLGDFPGYKYDRKVWI